VAVEVVVATEEIPKELGAVVVDYYKVPLHYTAVQFIPLLSAVAEQAEQVFVAIQLQQILVVPELIAVFLVLVLLL
jgi:hypothetical protein